MSVTVRAPAKINLHLGVGSLGADGFHPLATVYQAIGLYDDVTVHDAPSWAVEVRGERHVRVLDVPADDDNLAVRAGRALLAHHGLERAARIEIHKGIPVAGGLAGGSADAAATLVALDRLWDLQTPDDDLLEVAGRLGSDVPFALLGGTALGEGHGEQVSAVDDAGAWWWVAVLSDRGLSTPDVYRRFDERLDGLRLPAPEVPGALRVALGQGDPGRLAQTLANDLQAPALDLRPDLAAVFEAGASVGALASLLSGSGPTVLMLCDGMPHAQEVTAGLTALGHESVLAAPGPVAGAHVVEYA